MPSRRRHRTRDQQRLAEFLQTKCLICYDQGTYPSSSLPCCKKHIHEDCLRKWLVSAPGNRDRCPHCTQTLVPVNKGDRIPHIPEGSYLFTFQIVRYCAIDPDALYDRWLNPAPIPPPPPGWHEFRMRDVNNSQ